MQKPLGLPEAERLQVSHSLGFGASRSPPLLYSQPTGDLLCSRPAASYLSILTRAGMPPDLKMESRPSRWCERLCRMLVVQRAVSRSLVLCMVRTTAATICGDCIRARREASFLESWFTIMAALLTTTCGGEAAGGKGSHCCPSPQGQEGSVGIVVLEQQHRHGWRLLVLTALIHAAPGATLPCAAHGGSTQHQRAAGMGCSTESRCLCKARAAELHPSSKDGL